mgnify:CR=1 FL=1
MRQSADRNHHVSDFTVRHLAVLAGLMLTLLMFAAPAPAAERSSTSFNHLSTGFPLTGAHVQADCQTCHARGVFKGTPRQCELCHTQGSRMASSAKPTNHVPTAQPCDQCHTSTVTWAGARFPHTGVVPGSCMQCHNNSMAQGKPSNHVQTTSPCDTCHRTTAWIPASFNHNNVAPGSCITCHNNCSTATCKPGGHLATNESCDVCHSTARWLPAKGVSHLGIVTGCISCHNGSRATGKSGGHFVTSRSCEACHTPPAGTTITGRWPVHTYSHTSPAYSTHSGGLTCANCHKTNNETIAWSAYPSTCAGCHASKFKPDSHKKTTSPTTINYTVDELKNCAGSCHEYTNNTFSTIKTTRSSKHKSTDGGF